MASAIGVSTYGGRSTTPERGRLLLPSILRGPATARRGLSLTRRSVGVWARRAVASGTLGLALPTGVTAQVCEAGTISEIIYDRLKPFGEEATSEEASLGWLFRGLNAAHMRTLPTVVRWELLFEEGDCLTPTLLEESARSLRSLPYIIEADITSEQLADGTHRVQVRTQDAWALSIGIAFTVDNGFQFTGISVNAKNLLGTGTQVGVFRNVYRERSRVGLLARQPNLFGTRLDVTVHGGETRSGNYLNQSIFRPYAGEVGVNAFRQSVAVRDDYFLYSVDPELGFTQAYLRYEADMAELTYQRRFGDEVGTRFIAGIGASYESVRFPFGPGGYRVVLDNEFDDPQPALPGVEDEIGPQVNEHTTTRVSFTLGVRNLSFINLLGLDAVRASQDVQRGADATLTIAPGFPYDSDQAADVLIRAQGAFGTGTEQAYMRASGDIQTRYVSSDPVGAPTGWRDFMYEINGNGYWEHGVGGELFGRAQLAGASSTDRPFQLTLGGREAVRGYNDDAYPGGRRLLGTIEQRLPLSFDVGFADLGVAVFADAGKMWAAGVPYGEDTGLKAGVGAGLRIGLPAGAPTVLRIDLGVPLTGEREQKGTVFRIYAEFLGILDRRSWPSQTQRSRWYGVDSDLTTRPVNPLAGN